MKVHHIGYAVKDIAKSLPVFQSLGYEVVGGCVEDISRKVCIQFVRLGGYMVELIAPLQKDSPVSAILAKNKEIPYHLCYQSEQYEEDLKNLTEQGFLVIEGSRAAIALDNCRVAFLYKRGMGLLELKEESGSGADEM